MATAIELFEFLHDGTYYRYTSGSVTVVKDTHDFTAVPIAREPLVHNEDLNQAGLSISLMRDNPFAVAALQSTQPSTVTIYGEYSGGTWTTIWKGRIVHISMSGSQALIQTDSLYTIINRAAFHAKYQIACRHVLFSTACGVAAASYKFAGTVSVVDGITITIPGLDAESNDYYTGGYVKFDTYDYRTITDHTGNVITLYLPVVGLEPDASAAVYPGCDHSETDCKDKFSNLLNYGGFPWIPSGQNPFNKSSAKPRKRRR